MSFAVVLRRCAFLGVLVAPLAGCTSFQTIATDRWFEGRWMESEPPINHVLTLWDNRVRITKDSKNNGVPLPVLAGRLFLFNEDQHTTVDAHGSLIVQMHDVSNPARNRPPVLLAEWKFDQAALRTLKRKDGIGDGYTLVLPWEAYNPQVREVQLQVIYIPRNGEPRHAEPQNVTLQSADQPAMRVTQSQVVPAQEVQLQQQRLRQAQEAIPIPVR